jgi:hypothetical protein
MTHILLRRTTPHQNGITGDGVANMIDWNDVYDIDGIIYDPSTGKCRLPESGIYTANWSLVYGNINENNTFGAGWFHGGISPRHEPFIYNGNPWVDSQRGGIAGGGSDICLVEGAHTFKVDINQDPFVYLVNKIGGNPTKNVVLVYDSFFSIVKK